MNKCKTYQKMLPLLFYEELSGEERKELEGHLNVCSECQLEWEEARGVLLQMGRKVRVEPTDALLTRCREQLRGRLRAERRGTRGEKWWQRVWDSLVLHFSPAYGMAAGAVACLIIGVLLGRFLWVPKKISYPIVQEKAEASLYTPIVSEPQISNLEFISFDPTTGQLEVRFNTINMVVLKGKMTDEPVRRILAYTLKNEEHPGLRLKTVQALVSRPVADDEILEALIYVLEHDENPGVRLKAVRVLGKLPIDNRIKNILIRLLLSDPNSAIRIEAIEALSKVADETIKPIFMEAASDDENDYVRLRASKILERTENPEDMR